MKKSIKTITALALSGIAIAFAFNANAQCGGGCSTTPIFEDLLNNNASNLNFWKSVDQSNQNGQIMLTNSNISLTKNDINGSPVIQGVSNSVETRVYRPLGLTLGNSWRAECTFNLTGGNAAAFFPLALTSGIADPQFNVTSAWASGQVTGSNTIEQVIAASVSSNACLTTNGCPFSPTSWKLHIYTKKGSAFNQQPYAQGISIPSLNVNYRIVLERVNAGLCQLSLFDATTNAQIGQTVCWAFDQSITGLNTLQCANASMGHFSRSVAGTVDNYKIFNCVGSGISINSNTNNICPNTPVTLCATANGAANCGTYTWQPGGLIGQSITVTPATTTTYTVTSNCPCPMNATFTVNVTPSPASSFSADFSTVAGNSTNGFFSVTATPFTLNSTINNTPNAGYAWIVQEVDAAGIVVPGTTMINPANWQNSNNTITFPGYCCNTTIIVGDGSFQEGKKYRITRAVWGTCKPLISVSYEIFKAPGLKSTSTALITKIEENNSTTAIIPESSTSMKVFPNPSESGITILTEMKGVKNYEVINVNGQVIRSVKSAENSIGIDLNEQPNGLYFIKVTDENGVPATSKLIKK